MAVVGIDGISPELTITSATWLLKDPYHTPSPQTLRHIADQAFMKHLSLYLRRQSAGNIVAVTFDLQWLVYKNSHVALKVYTTHVNLLSK